MSRIRAVLLTSILITSTVALASPVSPATWRVIPSAFEQVLCIDYHTVVQSKSALALKAAVFPRILRDFEAALTSSGVDTTKDLGNLTFASFRDHGELRTIGVASGSFSALLKKVAQNPTKTYRGSNLYLMVKAPDPQLVDGKLETKQKDLDMTFLDETTLLFGDRDALETVLNVFNGDTPSIEFNRKIADFIRDIDKATVWSVLDRRGTLGMLHAALGAVTKREEYPGIRKQVLGSLYAITLGDVVKADLTVLTPDPESAAALAALFHLGALLPQKIKATPVAKVAVPALTADFDVLGLEVHFRADPILFQKMLQAQFFDVLCATEEDKSKGKEGCRISSAVPMPLEKDAK